MLVECTKKPSDVEYTETAVTVGKQYSVLDKDDHDYLIVDDNGKERYYQLEHFKEIDDVSDSCINRTVKKAVDAGSCNFCSRNHRDVNVITGESHLEVRFCNKCLKELSNYR